VTVVVQFEIQHGKFGKGIALRSALMGLESFILLFYGRWRGWRRGWR